MSLGIAWGLENFGNGSNTLEKLFWLRCPSKLLLGIPCPTCGLGHSLYYAWVGEWSSSLQSHFLGVVILLVTLSSLALLWFWPTGIHKLSYAHFRTRLKPLLPVLVATYVFWGFFLR